MATDAEYDELKQKYDQLIVAVAKGLDPIAVAVNDMSNMLAGLQGKEVEKTAPQPASASDATSKMISSFIEGRKTFSDEIQKEFLAQVRALRTDRNENRRSDQG